jgi:hypothetical protein
VTCVLAFGRVIVVGVRMSAQDILNTAIDTNRNERQKLVLLLETRRLLRKERVELVIQMKRIAKEDHK